MAKSRKKAQARKKSPKWDKGTWECFPATDPRSGWRSYTLAPVAVKA